MVVEVAGRWVQKQKKSHQRVITTRWWLKLQVGGWNSEEKPPTSLYDSLVVVEVAVRWVEWRRKATNES